VSVPFCFVPLVLHPPKLVSCQQRGVSETCSRLLRGRLPWTCRAVECNVATLQPVWAARHAPAQHADLARSMAPRTSVHEHRRGREAVRRPWARRAALGLVPVPCARSEYGDRTPENHRGRRRHRRGCTELGGACCLWLRPFLVRIRIPCSQLLVDVHLPSIVVAGAQPGRDFGHAALGFSKWAFAKPSPRSPRLTPKHLAFGSDSHKPKLCSSNCAWFGPSRRSWRGSSPSSPSPAIPPSRCPRTAIPPTHGACGTSPTRRSRASTSIIAADERAPVGDPLLLL
jgi:hypothetical protein